MQPDQNEMECVQVGINVFPTKPPPPPPPPKGIPSKLLAIMAKYKYNWRLDQLSKPKPPVSPKFIAPIVKPRYDKKQEIELWDETKFYSDHMSRPLIRTLVINKNLWGRQNGLKYRKSIRKRIVKSWKSIYNYYKFKERQRRLRKMRMEKPDKTKKKPKVFKRTETLAMPKTVKLPPIKQQKKKKKFSAYKHLEVLAAPVSRPEPPPKREGVNPFALTCQPSEITLKLAQLPERWSHLPKPLVPGAVKKSALKYKITPRIEALAVPRPRSEKAKNAEDEAGPWTISKSALTYKATPRILELAKPIERD